MKKSGFTHEAEAAVNQTDQWLTPRPLYDSLGHFDLDPCAHQDPKHWLAPNNFCLPETDGLLAEWKGSVFCNPPYGDETGKWVERCSLHNDAVLLVYARTETLGFRPIWKFADAISFIYPRVAFVDPVTVEPKKGGGAPSCLVAFGEKNIERLRLSACKLRNGIVVTEWECEGRTKSQRAVTA